MFGPIKRKAKAKEDPAEKLREQEATARVYAEFVKSFQVDEEDGGTKTFVRGGVIDPNRGTVESVSEKPRVYKPPGSSTKRALWLPPASVPAPQTTLSTALGKGVGGIDGLTSQSATAESRGAAAQQKTKEIDSFFEEIKRKQELLNQRRHLRQVAESSSLESERQVAKRKLDLIESQTKGTGSIPGLVECEETTNLYLGNLSPDMTEEYLCQQFGKAGVITSVKIMYPRNDEERGRKRLCGFCSFETREQAERAKNTLDGVEMLGVPIRIGWGKAIQRPASGSTPLSVGVAAIGGLPLAPLARTVGFSDTPPETRSGTVVVKVPSDKKQKAVIDLVAQYVVEDGYELEQLLLERCKDEGAE